MTVQPEQVVAGDFTRLDVRVPTERDNASTTKVAVQFPPGFLSVSTEPVPGWDMKITKRKLDKPVEQFGEQVTEEVGQVTFTGDGETGVIGPGSSRTSGSPWAFRTRRRGTLAFKAVQTYSNGEVVRWIGPPDADEPAPQVKLTSAQAEEGAAEPAAAEQAPPRAEADDGGCDALAMIAVMIGMASLAAGLFALFARRGSREAARVT